MYDPPAMTDRETSSRPTGHAPAGRDLLLLEDNPVLARVVTSVAQGEGWQVHTCIDAEQVVETLSQLRPTAAIVDCMLAEGSGLDVLGRLASVGRDIPVLIVSGYGDTLLRLAEQTAERCGLTRIATQSKPFSAAALRSFLQEAAPGPGGS